MPRVKALRLAGAPDDPHADLEPLVCAAQRDRVLGFVERARQAGARLLTGGRAAERPGFFVEPTVVARRLSVAASPMVRRRQAPPTSWS